MTTSSPNILLLTIDCWRGDHLGFLPSSKVVTPGIDSLCRESAVFSRASTAGGWTKLAMTAMLSSTFPSTYDFCRGSVSSERPWLSEELQRQGYATQGLSTNTVCRTESGFARGFDSFLDFRPPLHPLKTKALRILERSRIAQFSLFHRILRLAGVRIVPLIPTYDAHDVVERVLQDLPSVSSEKPFFTWVHFMDLHWPYRGALRKLDPIELAEMWQDRAIFYKNVMDLRGRAEGDPLRFQRWEKLFAEEMKSVDQALGLLFSRLRARKDWENTVVLLTGDHGEEFLEHGTWGHSWNQLHKEGVRVPLILKAPGQREAEVCNKNVSHLDIAPTLLELAGLEIPERMVGESLLVPRENRLVPCEMMGHRNSDRYRLSLEQGSYRYIYQGDQEKCQLYNIDQDPDERVNLYNLGHPKQRSFDLHRLQQVSRGLLKLLPTGERNDTTPPEDFSEEDPLVLERLRALGYVE